MTDLRIDSRATRQRAAILDACAAATSPDFLEEVSARLRRVVPHEGAFWSAADPVTTLATSPARVDNISADSCAAFWDAEFLVEDFLRFTDLARDPRGVATLHGVTGGRPARSTRYHQVNVVNGFDDELRAALRSNATCWGVLVLYRATDDPAFSEDEQEFVGSIGEALALAFRRLTLARPTLPTSPAVSPGVLLFDTHGRLVATTETVETWLAELPASTPVLVDQGLPIPTEVFAVVGQARAIAAGRSGGTARARILGRAGRWLVAHASVLDGSAPEDDGRIAVVIEPASSSEVVPIVVEAFGLTPREREVVTCVARGLDTGEIAAHLFLSPHTVRDHLKAVFEKVGVSSRGELVARVFATVNDIGAHLSA